MFKLRTPDYNEITLLCSEEELLNAIKEALKTNDFVNLSYTFTTSTSLRDSVSEQFPLTIHSYLHPINEPFTDMLTIFI